MRYLTFLLLVHLSIGQLWAQPPSIIVLQATSADGVEQNDELRNGLQSYIDSELASSIYGSLGCRLDLSTASQQRISGMAKRTISQYNYEIVFKDYVLDYPVGEKISGVVSGSGADTRQAQMDAIRKIQKLHFSSQQLNELITQHHELMPPCQELFNHLSNLNQRGKGVEVLAVYAQIGDQHECSAFISELSQTIYEKQQAANCKALMIRAKSLVVTGDITRAARLLTSVDPTLTCADEVEELLDELLKKDILPANINWYRSAYQQRIISLSIRRRIMSKRILQYVYQYY